VESFGGEYARLSSGAVGGIFPSGAVGVPSEWKGCPGVAAVPPPGGAAVGSTLPLRDLLESPKVDPVKTTHHFLSPNIRQFSIS
jgi:hypothetical protein